MDRLDRLLVSDDWEVHFGNATQTIQNHSQITFLFCWLRGGGGGGGGGSTDRGPEPFRFENMWLKTDGFKDRIAEW